MRELAAIGPRWARLAAILFLVSWLPVAGALFVVRHPWTDSHRIDWWLADLVGPTALLGVASVLIGLLAHDVLILAGRGPEPGAPDPQAADYDDKQTPSNL